MSSFKMGEVIPLIQAEATKQGVDPMLAVATFIAENTSDGVLKPDKPVSLYTKGIVPETGQPSGAVGLFQVVGSTLKNLMQQGRVPPNLDYNTLEGQVTAGVAAVKEAFEVSGGKDPLAAASQYVNGNAGLAGYKGAGPMPAQTSGYLPKIARAMGMSWSGKRLSPEAEGALTASSDVLQGIVDKNLPMLRAMGLEVNKATESGVAAVEEERQANVGAITAAGMREKATIERDNKLLSIFNLDDRQLQQSMDRLASSEAAMKELKPGMDHLLSVNPMANPVAWVAAQFQLGSIVPQYNAAVTNANAAAQAMGVRQQMNSLQKTLTPAVTIDQINTEVLAKSQMANALAKANLAKLEMDNINARGKFMSEELQYGQALFNASASQAKLKLEHLGLNTRYGESEDANKSAEADQLARINVYRIDRGMPPIPTMKLFNAMPADQKEWMVNAANNVATPGVSLRSIYQGGSLTNLQRTPGMTAMGDQAALIFEKIAPKVREMVEIKKMKEGDAIEQAVNAQYKSWREELKKDDMSKVSSDNPYRMNPDQYAKSPELANNGIAQFVNTTGKSLPNLQEREILQYAASQVRTGAKTPDQVAQELTEFFQKGAEFQFKYRGLSTLGFDSRTYKEQPSYRISRDIFSWKDKFFGAPPMDKPTDFMNLTETKHFLVQTVSQQAAEDAAMKRHMPGMGPGTDTTRSLGGTQ